VHAAPANLHRGLTSSSSTDEIRIAMSTAAQTPTSPAQPAVRAIGLAKVFGSIKAVDDISFDLAPGRIYGLLGANGAGKTTILRTISGLLRPTSGRVVFEDQDISGVRPYKIVARGISHVPERRGIFANLTVYENLLMGAYTRKIVQADFDEVYGIFPRLAERRKQIAGTLSGGEQQMLAISRALLAKPKVMLLDEPSLGLAPQITKQIFDTIKRINANGTTVLLVEQNALGALKIAHRGYVLEVGEITGCDKSEVLLANDSIRKAYLGEAQSKSRPPRSIEWDALSTAVRKSPRLGHAVDECFLVAAKQNTDLAAFDLFD